MTSPERTAVGPHPYLRPKDAATLIVLSRDGGDFRMLMGRRSDRHAFMPGMVVFPGGRVDPQDRFAPVADDLHPAVAAKLRLAAGTLGPARARAIALAAIRETAEETGVLIGATGNGLASPHRAGWTAFAENGVTPMLSPLRLVARAITPPGRNRRFDARFFAVFAEAIAAEVRVAEDELISPAWLTFAEARSHPLPGITQLIVQGLEARLAADPELSPDGPAPFYTVRHGRRVQQIL